jgi:hypothetical protein
LPRATIVHPNAIPQIPRNVFEEIITKELDECLFGNWKIVAINL